MPKLKPREKLILIVTVCLAVVFVVYQFMVKPMHEGTVGFNDRLRSDLQQMGRADQMVAQKASVEGRYQRLVDLIGTQDSDDAQMPTIVSKIETAARETNIHIGNIQPQKATTQKEVMFLSVELEIDGQWPDIVRFLYMLQQQPNLYFINELNLEKYSDSENTLRGRVVISRMCLVNP